MSKSLPAKPNLEHLKNEAKALLRSILEGDTESIEDFRNFHPGSVKPKKAKLADVQLMIARSYGFSSWSRLKRIVEESSPRTPMAQFKFDESTLKNIEDLRDRAEGLLTSIRDGDQDALDLLKKHPRENLNLDKIELVDAEHAIARAYGFIEWDRLETHTLISASSTPGADAIFEAIEYGEIDLTRALLQEDSKLAMVRRVVNAKNGRKTLTQGTLQVAAMLGHLEIVKMLVDEFGVDVYELDEEGKPPVWHARLRGEVEVVDYFLDTIPKEAEGTEGLGVDINLAICEGFTKVVRKVFERDPQFASRPSYLKPNALREAGYSGHVEVMKILLNAGAKVDGEGGGWRPLHSASGRQPEAVELLLRRGANPNIRVENEGFYAGFTPLHINAMFPDDNGQVTELLIAAGAEVNACDAQGRTPLEFSRVRGGRRNIEVVLKRNGGVADEETYPFEYEPTFFLPIHIAAQKRRLDRVKAELDRGIDPDLFVRRGTDGGGTNTPLWCAVQGEQEGGYEIAKLLLDHGADPNIINEYGTTAAHIACSHAHAKILELLYEYGADLTIKDHLKGMTPEDVARQGYDWQNRRVSNAERAGVIAFFNRLKSAAVS